MFFFQMSSSEEIREENVFSGESSFSNMSISSIELEDYVDQELEIEINRARQNSPHIVVLLQDQWPQHIREAPEYSSSFQCVEGE